MRLRILFPCALLTAGLTFLSLHCDEGKAPQSSEPAETVEKKSPLVSYTTNQLVQELKKGSEERKEAREQLINRGREVTDELLRHFDSPDFTVRWEVANILGILQDPKGVKPLVNHVLGDDNSHVRWRALWALTQIEDPEIPGLFRKALESEDETTRWNAAVGSSMFHVREALPVIYEGLKAENEFAAWEGVNALARMHEEASVEHLRKVLERPSSRLRRESVISLGKMKYPEAREILVGMLDDEDEGVRWRSAMGLSSVKDEKVRKALEARLEVETDEDVIKHLKNALRQYGKD